MGCVIGRIHMALRSYSVLDILLPSIIIIVQDHPQALNIYNMLSITFYFHYNIWGCMFIRPISVLGDRKEISIAHVNIIIKSEVSTFPIVIIFSVVVYLRCLLHRILSLIAYTFRENREFVFIIIVQFVMIERIYTLCLIIIIIKSEVWTITHCLGLGHETMVSTVCLSRFLWICDMAGLLRGTFVCLWYLLRIWPSVTDMQYYYHASFPTDDWHLAYMFSLVYLSVEVCLEGVLPHSVSTWRDSCVRVYAPLTLAPPHEKQNKIEQGDPGKPGICFHHYCAVYDECKYSDTFWLADRIRLFVQYTISLSSLCKPLWMHWTYKMLLRYILSSVWVRLSIFSPLSIIQYVGLYVFSLPISLLMIEKIYIYFVLLS